MHQLHTVYDCHTESIIPLFAFFPLIFVIIGLGIFLYNTFYADRNEINKYGVNKRKFAMFFGLGFALFALSMSAAIIASKAGSRQTSIDLYNSKNRKTVEGLVQNYHPAPAGGHQSESFTVEGVNFEFYDNDLADPGYHTAAVNGGVIKAQEYVMLTYVNYYDNKVILKIEVE